jgi:hypothetical protein
MRPIKTRDIVLICLTKSAPVSHSVVKNSHNGFVAGTVLEMKARGSPGFLVSASSPLAGPTVDEEGSRSCVAALAASPPSPASPSGSSPPM